MRTRDPEFENYPPFPRMGTFTKCVLLWSVALVLLGIGIRVHETILGAPWSPGFIDR